MTYIDYMNYFWRMDEALGFSLAETKLFFKLLDIGNKLNWQHKKLMIPMKKLVLSLDCSKNTILKARKRLCECGMISVEPGMGNKQAAGYQIICDYQKNRQQTHAPKPAQRFADDPNNEQTNEQRDERICDPTCDQMDRFPTVGKNDDQAHESTPNHTHDPTIDRTSEHTPDPYIRLDKDKDTDQKRVLINDPGEKITHEKILDLFHLHCPTLKTVHHLTPMLKENLNERSKTLKTAKDWQGYFQKVSESDFLCGQNKYNWQADFHWLTKNEANPQKVLTGQYDNYQKKKDPWYEMYYGKRDGYDFIRGIYPDQDAATSYTSDNHLVDAWAE